MSLASRAGGPRPIALCLERLNGAVVRCTATSGREAGLAIDHRGEILWRSDRQGVCDLWVSQDERLMVWRHPHAQPIMLVRSARWLELPAERAVVVRDQDELVLGSDRFRVHVHGYARKVEPPRQLRRVLLAGGIGAALAISSCGESTPATDSGVAVTPAADSAESDAQAADQDAALLSDAGDEDVIPYVGSDASDDIEVRETPPK